LSRVVFRVVVTHGISQKKRNTCQQSNCVNRTILWTTSITKLSAHKCSWKIEIIWVVNCIKLLIAITLYYPSLTRKTATSQFDGVFVLLLTIIFSIQTQPPYVGKVYLNGAVEHIFKGRNQTTVLSIMSNHSHTVIRGVAKNDMLLVTEILCVALRSKNNTYWSTRHIFLTPKFFSSCVAWGKNCTVQAGAHANRRITIKAYLCMIIKEIRSSYIVLPTWLQLSSHPWARLEAKNAVKFTQLNV
jgi:hypothetical protein